jgi:hypothetical protein
MEAVVASTVSTFNSTISGEAVNFSTLVYSQASTLSSILYEESQTYISTASSLLLTISAYTVSSISTLDAYVESTISVITLLVEVNISTISTAFFNQFVTAPSIILYNVVGISTLTNTAPITALDSLNASVADLDVTTYENFYILLSDLSNDVYYGLSYSTNSVTYNKNITVQIDIQSTYTNKFYIFDLDSFPAWLNRAPIYNPKSFSFLTNDLIQVPTNDTTPQVYISSFIGSYILNFRLTQTAMYINSIDCFPFVFSQLRLTGMTIPTNVQTTNPVFSNAFNLMYCGSRMSMTWDTNDLNIPLGVKFIGKDYVGSTIISWSGPYPSGTRSANIKIPTAPTPFAVYNSMYLGIFPNTASLNATTDGNIHTTSMLFDQSTFSKPFGVVSPTLNSRITVKNPGTINQFLQVSELKVTNIKQQNVVTDYLNQYARLTSSNFISVYNTDYGTYGPQRAFDGNLSTFYQGGFTTGTPDVNNKFYGAFSTFDTKYESTVFISTVEITGYVTSLSGMQIRYENANIQPSPYFATTYAAITDNTFYSTITLKSTYRQVFTFN